MLDSELVNPSIDRARHTVLVVDDDPTTRYATARILRAAGFQTHEAATGAEALRETGKFSAVVLDVHLPDIDGFEVCRILRSQPETALLPVMHVSAAHVSDEDKVVGLNAGGDAYLVRPVEPAVLVATLQALIRARMAEDQLRKSESRFRAIYSHARSGIALIDARGCFTHANPAMCQLLGRSQSELLGVEVCDLAPAAGSDAIRESLRLADVHSRWQGEFALLRPDATLVHLEWIISSHVEPGLRIGIALDASERIEMAERRQELLEREQAARIAAEHHSRTKDDFIAVLSHELRTPLNAILGWVYILNRRGGAPELLEGLDAIDRNVKTQVRIISDILDVSRIAAGKMNLHRETVNPADLVVSSIAALDASIVDKRLSIIRDLSRASSPAWLDPARFQQILWNLLTNAIKFSLPENEIRVTLACDGRDLSLVVQDFGEGIRPEFLAQVFDRFSQSASPGNRSHDGLGLGLSIVKHLTQMHGGTVTAHSEGPGKGTLMRVDFPVAMPVDAQGDPRSSFASMNGDEGEGIEAADFGLEGVDILVVEDNADASKMLGVVLADRGANVRFAIDYDSALGAVREHWPDVLVSDVGLPGRDGYELIRQLRSIEPSGATRTPAIALTAFARSEDRVRALAAGFDEHLGKPLNAHALLSAVATLRRRASRHPVRGRH